MKPRKILISAFCLAAVVVAALILPRGLSSARASTTKSDGERRAEPWSFKEGRGILLSDPARRALAVETAPVEFGALDPEPVRHSAQVYRTASESPEGKAAASLWLPPAQAAAVSVGQSVEVRHEKTARPAKVIAKRAGLRADSSPVEILLEINDDAKTLGLSNFVAARFPTPEKSREGAVVKSSAVVESVRGPFVYARNGEAYLRTPVKLGARSGDRVEIVDGLFEGDEVVASGAQDLWLVELQAVNGGKGCADGH